MMYLGMDPRDFSAINSKMDNKTIDTTPTSGSDNLVTSGGVYTAINELSEYVPKDGVSGQVWTSDGAGAGMWADVEGGEVWEEVDFTNFPTDWVNGDRIKIQFKSYYSLSSNPTSWETSFTASPTLTANAANHTNVLEYMMGSSNSYNLRVCVKDYSGYIAITSFEIYNPSSMNSGNIGRMYGTAFNGKSISRTNTVIDSSEASDYINKMWRLKQ